jgi:hypothetical protein
MHEPGYDLLAFCFQLILVFKSQVARDECRGVRNDVPVSSSANPPVTERPLPV